jgi:hypothetical protein
LQNKTFKKENKRLKKEVIQLTQMIEDLRKNSHFDINNEKPEANQIRQLHCYNHK